jgi:hypothetical protein
MSARPPKAPPWPMPDALGVRLDDPYDGAECYGCGEQAVVTDVNGLDLCRSCADACRIPGLDA